MAETVYDRLLEGDTVEDEPRAEPCSVEIRLIADDPRKVTLYCDCGGTATYILKAARRIVPTCTSSACVRDALPRLERWAQMASNNAWEELSEEASPRKPRLSATEEIKQFQREVGLEPTGELSRETCLALREHGRGGMLPVWLERLQEESSV